MTETNEEKKNRLLLKMTMAAQIINEGMDELKHIKEFRGQFKVVSHQFENHIARIFNPSIQRVFDRDDETAQKIMAGIERLCGASAFTIVKFEEIMRKLEENQDSDIVVLNIDELEAKSETEKISRDSNSDGRPVVNASLAYHHTVTQ